MMPEFSSANPQKWTRVKWTSVDRAAIDMESKFVQLSYRKAEAADAEELAKQPAAVQLDSLEDVSPRSRRLRALARKALRTGMQLVIEVRDLTPVKTIGIYPTA